MLSVADCRNDKFPQYFLVPTSLCQTAACISWFPPLSVEPTRVGSICMSANTLLFLCSLGQANGGALLENVRERGEQLRAGLEQLRLKYPHTIAGTRTFYP